MPESAGLPARPEVAVDASGEPRARLASAGTPAGPGSTKLVALVLGVLALVMGIRVPLAGGRGVVLGVIVGIVAGAVGLVLGLGARTQALQAKQPVGLCTAAVAIAVAGTLLCTLWVVLLLGLGPLLHGASG